MKTEPNGLRLRAKSVSPWTWAALTGLLAVAGLIVVFAIRAAEEDRLGPATQRPGHTAEESAYLTTLESTGTDVGEPHSAIRTGRDVCTDLQRGYSQIFVLSYLTESGRSGDNARAIVDSAVATFCPDAGALE